MRFVIAVAGCFSFLAAIAPGPASSAQSLEALLAKSRASSGSPYLYHIVSRSKETQDGRTYDVTTETEGLKYRARRCIKSICSGFYFDGDRSYDSNFNDTALPRATEVDGLQLTLRAIASYAFAAPDFRAKGGTVSERPPVARDGKTYRALAVAPRFGALLDAIVDPETGIVAGVASDEQRIAFEFRDQRKVGEKLLLPFTIALNGSVMERFDDRRIASDPLESPPGLAPKISGSERIAFEKADPATDRAIVPCSIGGQSVGCLFDTGNSGMSMSAELAQKLGLEALTASADVVRAPALAVGNATYPQANYLVLHDVHRYGYDVVLGADAFAHARVTIDYGARTVAIVESRPSNEASNFEFVNFVPVAAAKLDDVAFHLAIDTGDDSAIDLNSDAYAAHPSLFKATGAATVAEAGGTAQEVTGRIHTVRFENFVLTDLAIGATKNLATAAQGRVGGGLLNHFVVTFDYARLRIELAPRGGDESVKPAGP